MGQMSEVLAKINGQMVSLPYQLQTGDIVRLDLAARRLDMLVPEAELAARRAVLRQQPR